MDFALQALLGSVCLVGGDHLDEAKTTRLLGVRIAHDVALLDLAILLEEASNLFFGQGGVDASDEQVGSLIAALLRLDVARLGRRATVQVLAGWASADSWAYAPAVTAIGRGTAGARVVDVTALAAR